MDKYPKNFTSRVLTLNLRFGTLLGGMGLLFGGFVFVFVLGLLLGGGYDLGERLPALANVLPEKAPVSPPLVIAKDMEENKEQKDGQKKDAAGEQQQADGKATGDASADSKTSASGVINQGDLAYRDSLKPDKASAVRKAEADARDKKKTAEEKKDPKKKEERFNYRYQAASYKAKEHADRFVTKLKAAGINASTVKHDNKGSTWYRVIIDFTGTPSAVEEMQKRVGEQGVSGIVMLSKRPVR